MCLMVSDRHFSKNGGAIPQPFVSDKDILVFKALNAFTNSITTNDGHYTFTGSWSTYPTHDYVTPAVGARVTFENKRAAMMADKFTKDFCVPGKMRIHHGIHASTSYGNARLYGNHAFYAIIPAGTEFYIGVCSDIVSKKIVIFETVEEFYKYRDEKPNDVIGFDEFDEKSE